MGLGWVDTGAQGVGPSLQIQLIEVTKTLEEGCKPSSSGYRSASQEMAAAHLPVPAALSMVASAAPSLQPLCPAPTLTQLPVGSSFALCPSAPAPASQSLSPPPHHLPQFLCPAAEPRGVRLHFRLPLHPPTPPPCTCPFGTHPHSPALPTGGTDPRPSQRNRMEGSVLTLVLLAALVVCGKNGHHPPQSVLIA